MEQVSVPAEEIFSALATTDPQATISYNDADPEWLRSKKLCETCQSLFRRWPETQGQRNLRLVHGDFGGLRSSAESGCPICGIFLGEFAHNYPNREAPHEWPHDKSKGTAVVMKFEPKDWTYVIQLTFEDHSSTETCICTSTGMYGAPILGKEMSTLMFVSLSDHNHDKIALVNEYTDTPGSWSIAKAWLRTCIESHSLCSNLGYERILPSRLVYIASRNHKPRICLAQNLPPDTQYLTLSHCWGNNTFTTLTEDNLEAFTWEVPTEALTKTFSDALKATVELGFSYLWIDSLCILQDSEDDWKGESAMMGRIYANSSLNLAAVDAAHGRYGCFFSRNPHHVEGWNVLARKNHDEPEILWNCFGWSFDGYTDRNKILATRAWVFQERCLAPRTLCFGSHQITWECRYGRACETYPILDRSFPSPAQMISDQELSTQDLISIWFPLVEKYSGCRLTFRKDKLTAISGIAKLLARRFCAAYLAGLWKEDLYKQLVWTASYSHKAPKPINCEVPTWSWASIDSGIDFNLPNLSSDSYPLITIEEAFVNSSGDHFSEVNHGLLRIGCHFFSRREIRPFSSPTIFFTQISGIGSMVHPDHMPRNLDGELHFLPVLIEECEWNYKAALHGLVLKPHSGNYIRVGRFQVSQITEIERFLSQSCRHVISFKTLRQDVKSMRQTHIISII